MKNSDAVISLITREVPASKVASDLGIERATLYNWKRKLLGGEVPCKLERRHDDMTIEELEELRDQLRREVDRLELDKAILEKTVELLGKGQGADPMHLTSREKTLLVNDLRSAHKLKVLLDVLRFPKSTYLYQCHRLDEPDKYVGLRARISEVFWESSCRYGYRRIHACLKAEGITVSEKVVCRIMHEEGLIAKRAQKRKYSSYKGEIGNAPENLVKRKFHADAPNRLWLTDITEFSIPAGKVYLSPIIDCM